MDREEIVRKQIKLIDNYVKLLEEMIQLKLEEKKILHKELHNMEDGK